MIEKSVVFKIPMRKKRKRSSVLHGGAPVHIVMFMGLSIKILTLEATFLQVFQSLDLERHEYSSCIDQWRINL